MTGNDPLSVKMSSDDQTWVPGNILWLYNDRFLFMDHERVLWAGRPSGWPLRHVSGKSLATSVACCGPGPRLSGRCRHFWPSVARPGGVTWPPGPGRDTRSRPDRPGPGPRCAGVKECQSPVRACQVKRDVSGQRALGVESSGLFLLHKLFPHLRQNYEWGRAWWARPGGPSLDPAAGDGERVVGLVWLQHPQHLQCCELYRVRAVSQAAETRQIQQLSDAGEQLAPVWERVSRGEQHPGAESPCDLPTLQWPPSQHRCQTEIFQETIVRKKWCHSASPGPAGSGQPARGHNHRWSLSRDPLLDLRATWPAEQRPRGSGKNW